MLFLNKINSQQYKITGDVTLRDKIFKKMIWKHSHHQAGYLFTKAYKDGKWDGRVRLFTPTNIRAGYLEEVLTTLENSGEEYKLDFNDQSQCDITYEEFYRFCSTLIAAVKPSFDKKHNVNLEVRDYQIDAAWKFISQKTDVKTGIALHATSAGKSLTISFILGFLFYKNLIERAVILVPLQGLVTQFYRDLLDFGFKKDFVGKVYASEKQTGYPITIAMNPSLNNMIDTETGNEFFPSVGLVICDEVHKAASKTVMNNVLQFHNAKYFFGCTGTLPEDKLDEEKVFSLFGQILDQRKLQELKEDYNAVSNVKIGILTFCYGMYGLKNRMKAADRHRDWLSEVDFLQNDYEFRNPYIIQTIINNFKLKRNIVILVKNIDYGLKLSNRITEDVDRSDRKSIYWIDGSMKIADRDSIVDKCKTSKTPYIIVTNYQIFSTGVNLPNLNIVCLVDAGKSDITVAQTIGRGVRKTRSKDEVLIIDCSCDLKYGIRHGRKRMELYKKEGFEVFEKTIYRDEDLKLMKQMDSLR